MAAGLRFLFALFFFIIDVKAKAAVLNLPEASSVIASPVGCVPGQAGCALRTAEKQKFRLAAGGSTVVMGPETSLAYESESRLILLSGVIWIEGGRGLTVRTLYGEVRGEGSYWLWKEHDKVRIGVIDNEVEIFPRHGESLKLWVGMENWVGPMSDGRSSVGIPQAAVLSDVLELWAKLSYEPKRTFTERVQKFMAQWHGSVRTLSQLHRQMATRQMAGFAEEKRAEQERLRRLRAEEAEIRRLFREKNYHR